MEQNARARQPIRAAPTDGDDERRSPWTPPVLEALPRLTDLTLNTAGDAIGGGVNTGGGGSTVF